MTSLIRIPPAVMQACAVPREDLTTSLPYRHSAWVVRELFWNRLQRLVALCPRAEQGRVLDLGGGSGILLPTLSKMFRQVVCLDRFTDEAYNVVHHYALSNVTLIQGNLLRMGLTDEAFDVVIAADVLEHVRALPQACHEIYRITNASLLITGPTENLLYQVGRLVFGFQKPVDHFYTYRQVERHIKDVGFALHRRSYTPIHLSEPFSAFGVAHFIKA